MKLLPVTQGPPVPAFVVAAALMDAIGAEDFAARVLRALGDLFPASHCTVFALRSSGRVQAVSSASAIGEVATITAVEYMRQGFDRKDSNMVWLSRRKPGKTTQLWIGHQLAEDVPDEHYRRVCYGDPGIRERLSLLAVFADGYRVSVSLYRNLAYPDYESRDIERMAQHAPLIATAVMRHVQVTRRSPADHPPQARLMAQLSGRERQIITHMLDGLTTEEAAQEMGVAVTTALTYRYRAFQHLGVRSHRELLALIGASAPRAAALRVGAVRPRKI